MVFIHRITCIRTCLLLMGLLMLTAGIAQRKNKKPARNTETPQQVIEKNIRTYIGVLAHDSLEGRRTGTMGETKAVRYILEQYNRLGIAGGMPDGSFLQPFHIDEGKHYQFNTSLEMEGQPLMPATDFFVFPWSAEGKLHSTATVALQESGDAWWVDVDPILEKNKDNPHFVLAQHLHQAAKDAAAKGATALLVYNSSTEADSLAFAAKDHSAPVSIPAVYITRHAIEKYGIQSNSTPALQGTIGFVEQKRTGTNVVAMLHNGAPYTILLGAHFDHLGYGEDANSRHSGPPAIHNGADDNASGTAALLELARLLKENADRRFNFCFVHFSGEELGLYGSKFFADNPVSDLKQVSFMINMDMVGRLNDSSKVLTVGGIGTSPAWPALVKAPAGYTLRIDSSGTGPSDHTSFYRKDIPVLFYFTGLHTDYHKPGDDADKINYPGVVQIVEMIYTLIQNAPADTKLVFTKTREQQMGSRGFKVSIGIMPDYTFGGTGVKADGVINDRPAQKAGLQANDIILQLGDHLITGVDTYMQALNRFEKGQTTTIVVKRGNEVKTFTITF